MRIGVIGWVDFSCKVLSRLESIKEFLGDNPNKRRPEHEPEPVSLEMLHRCKNQASCETTNAGGKGERTA